ncbi:MAG: hypothetical protein ACR2NN_04985 [Bryobacteraceae bacterium]
MTVARWEVIVLVTGFGVITFWKLMTGGFRLEGLLRAQDGTFSPGRAQLLVLTIFTAIQYAMQIMQDSSHLPTVPSVFVMALAASQAMYLAGKAWSAFFAPKRNQ